MVVVVIVVMVVVVVVVVVVVRSVLSVSKVSTFRSKVQHYNYQGSVLTVSVTEVTVLQVARTSTYCGYEESRLSSLSVLLVLFYCLFQSLVIPAPGTRTVSTIHLPSFLYRRLSFSITEQNDIKFLLFLSLEAFAVLVAKDVQMAYLFIMNF